MNDEALAAYLGIDGTVECARILAAITPAERATYERMAKVEEALIQYMQGRGPRPQNVIICFDNNVQGE